MRKVGVLAFISYGKAEHYGGSNVLEVQMGVAVQRKPKSNTSKRQRPGNYAPHTPGEPSRQASKEVYLVKPKKII